MIRECTAESIHHKTVVLATVTIKSPESAPVIFGRVPPAGAAEVVMNNTASSWTGKVFCPDCLFPVFCVSDAVREPSSKQLNRCNRRQPYAFSSSLHIKQINQTVCGNRAWIQTQSAGRRFQDNNPGYPRVLLKMSAHNPATVWHSRCPDMRERFRRSSILRAVFDSDSVMQLTSFLTGSRTAWCSFSTVACHCR